MDVHQPQYLKPSGQGGGKGNVMAIDIGNTTEETVNVNDTNPVPVEETEPVKNTEK